MSTNGGSDPLGLARAIMSECMNNNFARVPELKNLILHQRVRFTQLGVEPAVLNQWETGWREEKMIEQELQREHLRDQAKEFLYQGLSPYKGRHGEPKARTGIRKVLQDFAGAAREDRDEIANYLEIHPAELQRILAGR